MVSSPFNAEIDVFEWLLVELNFLSFRVTGWEFSELFNKSALFLLVESKLFSLIPFASFSLFNSSVLICIWYFSVVSVEATLPDWRSKLRPQNVTGSVGANQLKIPPTIGICLRTPFKKVLNFFLVIKSNHNKTVK